MTSLVSVLGVMLLSLVVSSEVLPPADFNLQAMTGKWYLVGFASNSQWFVNSKSSMKMGTSVFTPTADGDLDMAYRSLSSDGSCWKMDDLARKTDLPGRFTYTSELFKNENNMVIVEAKYDEYALVYVVKTKNGVQNVVNKLYGRSADLSADLHDKFTQFCLETGILAENIVFLPRNAECPAA